MSDVNSGPAKPLFEIRTLFRDFSRIRRPSAVRPAMIAVSEQFSGVNRNGEPHVEVMVYGEVAEWSKAAAC